MPWKKAIEESQDKLSFNKEDFTAIETLGKNAWKHRCGRTSKSN